MDTYVDVKKALTICEKDLMVNCLETAILILRHHEETRGLEKNVLAKMIVKMATAFYQKSDAYRVEML